MDGNCTFIEELMQSCITAFLAIIFAPSPVAFSALHPLPFLSAQLVSLPISKVFFKQETKVKVTFFRSKLHMAFR